MDCARHGPFSKEAPMQLKKHGKSSLSLKKKTTLKARVPEWQAGKPGRRIACRTLPGSGPPPPSLSHQVPMRCKRVRILPRPGLEMKHRSNLTHAALYSSELGRFSGRSLAAARREPSHGKQTWIDLFSTCVSSVGAYKIPPLVGSSST